ncbi:MAG: CsbD family protein [Proteobacteria bacterium]|nr:CsbD family protein [Pseudomonadota bacterium]
MNKDIIEGNWQQLKGKVQKQWGNLTNDDLDKMRGTKKELEGLLQKKYGYQRDRVEEEIDKFLKANGIDDAD